MTESSPTPPSPELRHRIMAGFIGNVVEWYDFAVYGYLAGVIAPVFFSSANPTAALIGTYGIFTLSTPFNRRRCCIGSVSIEDNGETYIVILGYLILRNAVKLGAYKRSRVY